MRVLKTNIFRRHLIKFLLEVNNEAKRYDANIFVRGAIIDGAIEIS